MIKCIIFDVGNVLVKNGKFPESLMFYLAEKLDVEAQKLIARYNHLLPNLESRKGQISALVPRKVSSNIKNLYQKGAEKIFKLNDDLFELAKKLNKIYKVGLISNVDRYLAEIPLHQKVYSAFEKNLVVLSYRVGVRKPNNKIYKIFLQKSCCRPEECLFIDNTKENVTAARKLGMKGIVFKNNRQVKTELKKLLS